MPAASSLPNAVSKGIHVTTRQKDITKAAHYKKIRELYEVRTAYWDS
jgi:hypothetical protein